jgi:thiol:disulfide interchange protein DsbD
MIPIISSIVVGQGEQTSTRSAFFMSLAYVLAMALTYTAAGVIAGVSGANLQAAFQNPWIIGVFSLVFVALAFSMFGFYELQLPSRLQSKLTEMSNRQAGGTIAGSAVMGFLSALIVGPCVAAPLAGALIYISQSGDATLGGIALFALSMGMGTPLLLIGTSAGKLLPRVGGWMNAIKAVFGVLLLGLAIWMLERVLPASITMLLWSILLIVSAVYLGALQRTEPDATGWKKLWQGTGLVLLVYGVLIMIGAFSGGRDVLQPLQATGFTGGRETQAAPIPDHALPFQQVKGLDGLNNALSRASANNQSVMLDFYADWCVSCKEMEKYTFSDPGVQAALENVMLLQTDVTPNDQQDKKLMKQFGLFGPPSILFFDKGGNEKSQHRVVGFMDAEEFRAHVMRTLNQ